MTRTSADAQRSPIRPLRIVVADDDLDMRELVADCLRKDGYEVREASDGAELLVRVEDSFLPRSAEPIDLFVTDHQMPEYTGLQIVAGLREAGMDMPVVVITASDNPETRDEAEALGAAFLHKPFEMDQLRELVSRLMSPKAEV